MNRRSALIAGAAVTLLTTTAALMRSHHFSTQPLGFQYVARKGDVEVTLVPTIHAAPKPLQLPTAVRDLLARADALAVELDVTDLSLQQAALMCTERAASQLQRPQLSERQAQKLRQALRDAKLDDRLLEGQSPYLLAHLAAQRQMPEWSVRNGLDRLLIEHMRSLGRPVEALETTCSPTDALASVAPRHLTPELLDETIRDAKSPSALQRANLLLEAWERGDAELVQRTFAKMKTDSPLQGALASAVQAMRDRTMAQRLVSIAAAHRKVVAAVGMQHISSPPGIPGELIQLGWDIQPMP